MVGFDLVNVSNMEKINKDGEIVKVGGHIYHINNTYRDLLLNGPKISSIQEIEGLDEIKDSIRILSIINSSLEQLNGIEALINLEEVWFSNSLTSLEGIQSCRNLRILRAEDNMINSIAPLAPLDQLKQVYLKDNRIEHIEGLSDKPSLEILDLSGNRINHIKGLDGCSQLKSLNLSKNCLERIENFDGFPNLRDLDLSGNQIRWIENLHNLRQLEILKLENNEIQRVENLEHLTAEVNLEENSVISDEIDASNYNPALWCKIKTHLEGLCEDVAAGMTGLDRFEEAGYYIVNFLHLDEVYAAVAGHPAGKALQFHLGYDPTRLDPEIDGTPRIMDASNYYGAGPWLVAGRILDTSMFFGINTKEPRDAWVAPFYTASSPRWIFHLTA